MRQEVLCSFRKRYTGPSATEAEAEAEQGGRTCEASEASEAGEMCRAQYLWLAGVKDQHD